MQYQRFGERIAVRFESGEKVVENLTRLFAEQHIGYAALSGLGALSHASVSYWNPDSQEYEPHDINEQVELVSFIGNVSLKEGAPQLHAHVALAHRDLSLVGGHFNEGSVHPNCEIWIRPEKESVERKLDDQCGLYLMDLPERL
jgi:predicted DNA-binding protein with PD1-like motif